MLPTPDYVTTSSAFTYVVVKPLLHCPLGRVVKGESSVQSHSYLDGVGSIPAIPNARYVPSLLCHERFSEVSLLV